MSEADPTIADDVVRTLREHGRPMSPAEIVAAIKATNASYVRKVIGELLARGTIAKTMRGHYEVAAPKTPDAPKGERVVPRDTSMTHTAREPEATYSTNGLVRIDSVNVIASAGAGSEVEFEEVDAHVYLPAFLAREMFGAQADRVKRITISGTSMRPTLEPGQKAFVVLMHGEHPADGSVYVLRGPHGVLIKRLYFDTEVDPKGVARHFVRIHSDNPEGGTDRLPLDVFERDYSVVAHFRRVETAL